MHNMIVSPRVRSSLLSNRLPPEIKALWVAGVMHKVTAGAFAAAVNARTDHRAIVTELLVSGMWPQ